MSDIFNSESLTEDQRNELAQAAAIFEQSRTAFLNSAAFLDRNALLRVMADTLAFPFSDKLSTKMSKKHSVEKELLFLAIATYNAKQTLHKYTPKEGVEKAIVDETVNNLKESINNQTKENEDVSQQTVD